MKIIDDSNQNKTVNRFFAIIEELAKNQEIGLTELSQLMFMSKSTVYRFLQTMKDQGYISQNPETEKYFLTIKLFQISSMALGYSDIIRIANKYMKELTKKSKETVHLAVLDVDAKSILYIHKVVSDYTLSMMSQIGSLVPVYCTSMGKILTAYSSNEVQEKILDSITFRKFTPHTIDNVEQFKQELDLIKVQGYAEDIGEHEERIHCVAVPIYDRFGDVSISMSISWPEFRFHENDIENYLSWMREAANNISQELGYIKFK